MNPDEEIPPEEFTPCSYYGVTYWKRAVIVLAGSFAHLLMAFLCFYLIFWPLGVPTPTGRIEKAEKTIEISGKDVKTPAAEIGLEKGDLVTKVDGVSVNEWADLQRRALEEARPDGHPRGRAKRQDGDLHHEAALGGRQGCAGRPGGPQ